MEEEGERERGVVPPCGGRGRGGEVGATVRRKREGEVVQHL